MPVLLNAQSDKEREELKPALLVLDIQNAFLPMMQQEGRDEVFGNVNQLIEMFKKFDLPIIQIYHTSPKYGPEEGTDGFKFSDAIKIGDVYGTVIKNYGNAFIKTDLDKMLKEKGVNTVYICGLSATGCVSATYFGAYDLEYNSFMVKDALLGPNAEHTNYVEEIFKAVDINSLYFLLTYTQK